MPQRNGASPRVHLGMIDLQHVQAVYCHAGEGFVELDDVDVFVEVKVEFAEELRNNNGGTDAHDSRGDAGNGGTAEFGEDWLVHFDGFGASH